MRIGLISCSKSKTPYPTSARELYSPSRLFRGALAYLEGRVETIYILSAKYGLLALHDVVGPYDLTLKDATPTYRREWAKMVLSALKMRHGSTLAGITFELHTGEAYSEDLVPLLEEAGATCTSPVAGLRVGERLHFYDAACAPAAAALNAREHAPKPAPAPTRSGKITGVKIHVAIWLAAASLHDAGHPTFSPSRSAEEVERRFGDTRPGVMTHIVAHCVANAPKNTTTDYSYLFRTDMGQYRLLRPGDPVHASRSGRRTAPDQVDIPEPYWDLWRRWQHTS